MGLWSVGSGEGSVTFESLGQIALPQRTCRVWERLAFLCNECNVLSCFPWASSLRWNWSLFPTSKRSLILQLFSALSWVFFKYVSKSNNLLPLCCSLPLASFLLDGSPLSAPRAAVPSLCARYHGQGQFTDHQWYCSMWAEDMQESRSRGL